MKFIDSVNELMCYNWKAEQTSWEEETGETWPDNVPQEEDNHIFKALHFIDKFNFTQVKVYGKDIYVGNILNTLTDEELILLLKKAAENLAQEGRLIGFTEGCKYNNK